jgi:hypothetical protein
MQGIEYLKKSSSPFFANYRKNLEAGKCVTCGEVDLKDCDKTFGMCPACTKLVEISQVEFDKVWFRSSPKKIKFQFRQVFK